MLVAYLLNYLFWDIGDYGYSTLETPVLLIWDLYETVSPSFFGANYDLFYVVWGLFSTMVLLNENSCWNISFFFLSSSTSFSFNYYNSNASSAYLK